MEDIAQLIGAMELVIFKEGSSESLSDYLRVGITWAKTLHTNILRFAQQNKIGPYQPSDNEWDYPRSFGQSYLIKFLKILGPYKNELTLDSCLDLWHIANDLVQADGKYGSMLLKVYAVYLCFWHSLLFICNKGDERNFTFLDILKEAINKGHKNLEILMPSNCNMELFYLIEPLVKDRLVPSINDEFDSSIEPKDDNRDLLLVLEEIKKSLKHREENDSPT